MLTYIPASILHVGHLVMNLRSEDFVEAVIATGKQPHKLLERRLFETEDAMTLTVKAPSGRTIAMFGSFPAGCCPGEGVAWLLATTEVEQHSLSLMKTIGPYVDQIAEPYEALVAHMWWFNSMHFRWASKLGFVHHQERDVVVRGNPFFYLRRPTQR